MENLQLPLSTDRLELTHCGKSALACVEQGKWQKDKGQHAVSSGFGEGVSRLGPHVRKGNYWRPPRAQRRRVRAREAAPAPSEPLHAFLHAAAASLNCRFAEPMKIPQDPQPFLLFTCQCLTTSTSQFEFRKFLLMIPGSACSPFRRHPEEPKAVSEDQESTPPQPRVSDSLPKRHP
ncbi:hypothetical protein CB1_000820003 [Camelus ferus]|nr:hypothetical protein CB1_000820003 [Camelus ferus]